MWKPRSGSVTSFALLLCAFACGGASPKPGCGDGDLARINGAEQGEILLKCAGQDEDCSARAAIHARYKKQREEWFLRCQD